MKIVLIFFIPFFIYAQEFLSLKENEYIQAKQMFSTLKQNLTIKDGGGKYLINPLGVELLFQMPHCKSDLFTCEIGEKLYVLLNAKAATFSTLHRNNNQHSDLGKNPMTHFNAFAEIFVEQNNISKIIQIHGFAKKKRKTIIGKNTDIIVSSGSYNMTKVTQKLSKCFNENGFNTKLFPKEVKELGGTQNITAHILRKKGFNNFLHLELSYDIRKELVENEYLLKKFGKCLE